MSRHCMVGFVRAAAAASAALTLLLPLEAEALTCGAIVASDTAGVAPLGVVVEGWVNTTDPEDHDFGELSYYWHFGDVTDTWEHGPDLTDDRNTETGPVAAHVYETPGSKTITLHVFDTDGNSCQETLAITVDDPDVTYDGNTVCVSESGNFTGCPVSCPGLDCVTGSDFDAEAEYCESTGRRCLFRVGETYSQDSTVNLNFTGPVSIGVYDDDGEAFGSTLAIIDQTISGVAFSQSAAKDQRIWGFELQGTGTATEFSDIDDCVSGDCDLLIHRVKVIDHKVFTNAWQSSNTIREGVVVSEFEVAEQASGVTSISMGLAGKHIATIGGFIHDSTASNIWRSPLMQNSVIAHVRCENPGGNGDCFKQHNSAWWGCAGSSCPALDGVAYTEYNFWDDIICDHGDDSASSAWCMVYQPQNDNNEERLRFGRFERLAFKLGGPTRTGALSGFVLDCQDCWIRNFTCRAWGAGDDCIETIDREGFFPPERIHVMNGSSWNDSKSTFEVAKLDAGTGHTCKNILEWSPTTSDTPCTGATTGGNVNAAANPYTSADPTELGDFTLASGTPDGLDDGVTVPNRWDAGINLRPAGAAFDAGAWERDASPEDTDLDGIPDADDNCRVWPNTDQSDIGGAPDPDGIGDACQCGDANEDGFITSTDSFAIVTCVIDPETCDVSISDANNDGFVATIDAFLVIQAVNGDKETWELICERKPDATPP